MSCHLQIVSLLPVWLGWFSFFFCFIALTRISNTIWNKSGGSEFPCLVLILEEKLPVFHCWIWCKLWVLLCWYTFLYSHFFESFPHKSLLNFVQSFFWICRDDFYLSFFNVVCTLIDWGWWTTLEFLEQSCLIMIYNTFNVLLNSVC